MFLAYFDESGDTGLVDTPTSCFVLAGVLLSDHDWLVAIDETTKFRRFLKSQFDIKLSDELKASHLLKSKGAFSHLSAGAAVRVYEMCMRFQQKCNKWRTFAIVIQKDKIHKMTTNVRDTAWTYAIQRVERICAKGDGRNPPMKGHAMIFPDDGHGDFLRKKVRAHRRFHLVPSGHDDGTMLERPAKYIIEDPFDRKSHESYFVQFADLNAFAAYRHIAPTPKFGAGMWSLLGDSRIEQVNELTRSKGGPAPPCGIVVWPT